MKIIRKLVNLYRRCFWSFSKQAQFAGVEMGTDNFIASHFWSTEPYLIRIGSNCAITEGCKLFTHGGGRICRRFAPTFDAFGKVVLGDYVYLGTNTLVMPGVTIGNNVLVAAGSVVTKSVPDNVVVAGNPAKYICSVQDFYEHNKDYNVGTKGLSYVEKKKVLLQTDECYFIKKTLLKCDL